MCRWHSFSCNHPGRQGIPDSWGVTSSPWQNTAHSWDGMLPDLQDCSKTGSLTPPTIYVAGLTGSSVHYSSINALRHSLAVGYVAQTNKGKAHRAGATGSRAEESGFSLNNFLKSWHYSDNPDGSGVAKVSICSPCDDVAGAATGPSAFPTDGTRCIRCGQFGHYQDMLRCCTPRCMAILCSRACILQHGTQCPPRT